MSKLKQKTKKEKRKKRNKLKIKKYKKMKERKKDRQKERYIKGKIDRRKATKIETNPTQVAFFLVKAANAPTVLWTTVVTRV